MKPGIDYIGIAVTFICHDGQGNFLMHKRSQGARDEQGCWDFGGGTLEHGEELEAGLQREAREEFGCEMTINEALRPKSVFREQNGVKTHWILFSYITQADPTQVRLNDPTAMEEIGWFKLDALPFPLHSNLRAYLKHHEEVLKKYRRS